MLNKATDEATIIMMVEIFPPFSLSPNNSKGENVRIENEVLPEFVE
jgi:hypothetical protein